MGKDERTIEEILGGRAESSDNREGVLSERSDKVK